MNDHELARWVPWPVWWPVLVILGEADEEITVSEVSRRVLFATGGRTGRHPAHCTTQLERLRDSDLVLERQGDGAPRYRITDDGRALLVVCHRIQHSLLERVAA
jgi:hypothetical protein